MKKPTIKNKVTDLTAKIPRREPMAQTEARAESAERRSGLLHMHPAMKVADTYFAKLMDKLDDMRPDSKTPSRISRAIGSGANGGGGAAAVVIELEGPKNGSAWEIMRVATEVTNPGGAIVARIYLDDESNPLGKVHRIADASDYADAAPNNIYVPSGRRIKVLFVGVPAGSVCHVGMQVRQFIPGPALEIH